MSMPKPVIVPDPPSKYERAADRIAERILAVEEAHDNTCSHNEEFMCWPCNRRMLVLVIAHELRKLDERGSVEAYAASPDAPAQVRQ